ncbi:MAG: phosphoglucosamine mutase [Candidatus Bathyarchaeia archaeon]
MRRLFGSSGIRGLANVEITPSMAQEIGKTIASLTTPGGIVVGRDSRTTGKILEDALCSGAMACGADVLMGGIIPTPLVAWKLKKQRCSGGVVITASHNPPEYNGFKIFNERGVSVKTEEQKIITRLLQEDDFHLADWNKMGSTYEENFIREYGEDIMDHIGVKRDWSVACDCLCGATGTTAPKIFDEVATYTMFLNAQPDGRFPAGNPEPNHLNLSRLGLFVSQENMDIGFAFDGDGDRMMAVDEGGKPVSADRLLASYASHVTEREGGGVVVTHVGASMCIDEMVEEEGGVVKRTRVGDAFIAQAMEEYEAIFGGEPVGAWIHPSVHMCPDGVLSALKLLDALDEENSSLSEFINRSPEYPIIRSSLNCPEGDKLGVMEGIRENYETLFSDVKSVNKVDGIRLQMEDGWILVRPSGTEPLIRITVEARTPIKAEGIMEKGKSLLKNAMRSIR